MRIRIEARWIPLAVNCFADALSRTLDPGDLRGTNKVVQSFPREYLVDKVMFWSRPMGETGARRKLLATQMAGNWGDGRVRLLNPPFYFPAAGYY